MDLLFIIGLLLGGIILFIVEVMIIPGISIAGVMSAVCIVGANAYAFISMGTVPGFVTLTVSLLLSIGGFYWIIHGKSIDRMALKKEIDSTVATMAQKEVRVGDRGVAVTRLALIGNAEINGNILEVRSGDGFIDEKTPVVVERISDGMILVKRDI